MKISDLLTVLLVILAVAALVGGGIAGGIVVGPLLFKPTPTPMPTIIFNIEDIKKVEFTEYYMVVDVQHSEIPDNVLKYLGVKDEIIALVYGKVVGGFDLKEMKEDAIWRDGTRVQLKLPPPKILHTEIDSKQSYIVYHNDTCPGFFGCKDSLTTFLSDVEPAAKKSMNEKALENGLLERTATEGKEYYESFLKSLGFTEVHVVVEGYSY
jgi:hypothetical protein